MNNTLRALCVCCILTWTDRGLSVLFPTRLRSKSKWNLKRYFTTESCSVIDLTISELVVEELCYMLSLITFRKRLLCVCRLAVTTTVTTDSDTVSLKWRILK